MLTALRISPISVNMSTSYIPPRDADLLTWADNFSALVTATPATYGLSAANATTIAGVIATFDTTYAVSQSPATRSPANVAAKDAAKVSLLAVVRPFAQQIANNIGVSTDDKIALGLNPRTNTPTPVPVPNTNPVLTVDTAFPLQHVLRFRDSTASPSVKAKPPGVTSLQLHAIALPASSGSPSAEFDLIPLAGLPTTSPLLVSWPSSNRTNVAWYVGRWVTRKGLAGPWSNLINFPIA